MEFSASVRRKGRLTTKTQRLQDAKKSKLKSLGVLESLSPGVDPGCGHSCHVLPGGSQISGPLIQKREAGRRSCSLRVATIGIGIGVAIAIAVAIGFCRPTQPIATAIATPIPIPTDLVSRFLFDAAKCQPTYELICVRGFAIPAVRIAARLKSVAGFWTECAIIKVFVRLT
jgi:hypothetical protein